MNYLVTIWDAGGSVPPELALARRLVAAGHRVVVLAGPPLQPAVEAAGATFRSWQRVPHRRHPSEPEPFDDSDLSGPPQIVQMMLDRLIAGPARDYAAEVGAALDEFRSDALVSSMLMLGGMAAAEARGMPIRRGAAQLLPDALPRHAPLRHRLASRPRAAGPVPHHRAEPARHPPVGPRPPDLQRRPRRARPHPPRPPVRPTPRGRAGPRAHLPGVRLPRRPPAQRALRRPATRRPALGRARRPAPGRRTTRPGRHVLDLHEPDRSAAPRRRRARPPPRARTRHDRTRDRPGHHHRHCPRPRGQERTALRRLARRPRPSSTTVATAS